MTLLVCSLLVICIILVACVPSYLPGQEIPFENRTTIPDSAITIYHEGSLHGDRIGYSLFDGWKRQTHIYGQELATIAPENGKLTLGSFLFFALPWAKNKELYGQVSFETNKGKSASFFYNKKGWYSGPITSDSKPLRFSLESGIVLKEVNYFVKLRAPLLNQLAVDSATLNRYQYSYAFTTAIDLNVDGFSFGLIGSALTLLSKKKESFANTLLLPAPIADHKPGEAYLVIYEKNEREHALRLPLTLTPEGDFLLQGSKNEEKLLESLLYTFTLNQDHQLVKRIWESNVVKTDAALANVLLSEAFKAGYTEREQRDFCLNNFKTTRYLIQQGGNPNTLMRISPADKEPIIFKAGQNGCHTTVSYLIEKGANINFRVSNQLFIEYAAGWNDPELCRILIKAGVTLPDAPSEKLLELLKEMKKK